MDSDSSARPDPSPREDDIDIRIIGVKEIPAEPRDRPTQNVTAIGRPEHDGLRIYILSSALEGIYRHLVADTRREQGGVLLGKLCRDNSGEPFVDITDYIEARHTESSGVHLHFTIATWKATDEERERRYPNDEKIVVGWYHSHPGLGVFVSAQDRRVHQQFLSWWQTALVVDPVARDFGFFRTRGEWLLMCEGVYVYGDASPLSYARVPPFRQTLTRQVEDERDREEPTADTPPKASDDYNGLVERRPPGMSWLATFLLLVVLLAAFLGGVLVRDVLLGSVVLPVASLTIGLAVLLLAIGWTTGAFFIRPPELRRSEVLFDELLELTSEAADLQSLVVTMEVARGFRGRDRDQIERRCRHNLFCSRLDMVCVALSNALLGGESSGLPVVSHHVWRLRRLASDSKDLSNLVGLIDAFWSTYNAFAVLPALSFRVQSEMSLKPWEGLLTKYHELQVQRDLLCAAFQSAVRNNRLGKDISTINELLHNLEGDSGRKQHHVEHILDDLLANIEQLTAVNRQTLIALEESPLDDKLLAPFPSHRDRFVAWHTRLRAGLAERADERPSIGVEVPLGG